MCRRKENDFASKRVAAVRKAQGRARDFWSRKDGGIAIFAALSAPIVIGFAGLGVEVGMWYKTKANAQVVADLAAHAAAKEAEVNLDDDDLMEAVAIDAAAKYGVNFDQITATATDTAAGTRIDVTVEVPIRRYFSAIFNNTPLDTIAAGSSAIVETSGEACLLALDPDGDGVVFSGNTDVTLNNCHVMSNATGNRAFELSGSATLSAACASAVGTAYVQKSNAATFSECAEARSGSKPTLDPYAGIAMPDLTSATYSGCASLPSSGGGGGKGKGKGKKLVGFITGSTDIQSGRYCGGFKISGTMRIADGATIIIDGGKLVNQGPSYLEGENVTIILMNDAELKFNSQSTVNLSAKTTGTYAGLIFVGDAMTQDQTHKWNGGALTRLVGAFYLPTDTLELRGGANSVNGCLHMIAGEIDARGNSRFSNNCAGVGTLPLVVPGGVRLAS